MYKIRKILVPTDFSDNASKAYSHAQQIARRYDAKVDYIHVIPSFRYFGESLKQLGAPLDMEKDVYPHAQKQASQKINELMENYVQPENKGASFVKIAPKPSKAISEHATKNEYDLIVMAAKGQHNSDFLQGSITEKVIRYSKVPVLHTDKPAIENIKNILVPTDGSQASLQALPMAISIALKHGASIILYHVLELHGSQTENFKKNTHKTEAENIRDVIYDAIDEFFKKFWNQAKLNRSDSFDGQIMIGEGDSTMTVNINTVIEKRISAHNAITEYSDEHADLIIMATHGRSGLSHLLLGSTAEKVVQYSTIPAVTVRPEKEMQI